jgi:enoyl-[acyl-carrier-protein] reductase (NADH)
MDDKRGLVFAAYQRDWGRLDFLVHSIAFADRFRLKEVLSCASDTVSF